MNMPTDVQAAVDVLYNELVQFKNQIISDNSLGTEESEKINSLILKAVMYGELVNKRDSVATGIILRESNIDDALALGQDAVQDVLDHVQNVVITKTLLLTRGNATKAAALLGWNRQTFAKRRKRNSVDRIKNGIIEEN